MIMDAGFPKGPVADIVDSFGPNVGIGRSTFAVQLVRDCL